MNTAQIIGGGAALIALGLAASQLMGFVKYLKAKDWNAVLTNLAFFAIAFLLLLLAANANYTESVTIPGVDVPLKSLDIASLVIVALGIFGIGGAWYDRTKARDNTQSAAQPSLIPGPAINPDGGNV